MRHATPIKTAINRNIGASDTNNSRLSRQTMHGYTSRRGRWKNRCAGAACTEIRYAFYAKD
jgi:hypothetical protein